MEIKTKINKWDPVKLKSFCTALQTIYILDIKQLTGSKLGKKYVKVVYCYPAFLNYMLSTSWETLDWMKHKLESRLLGEISIISDMQMTSPLWQKVKKN